MPLDFEQDQTNVTPHDATEKPPRVTQDRTPGGRRILAWIALGLVAAVISGAIGGFLAYSFAQQDIQLAYEAGFEEGRENGSAPTQDSKPKETEAQNKNDASVVDIEPVSVVKIPNESSDGELTTVEIAAKASPSVVAVYSEVSSQDIFGREYSGMGAGSGVIISEDGYVVTNYHVVEGAQEVHVDLPNGQRQVKAKVVGVEPSADLAVLQLDSKAIPSAGLPAIEMGNSDLLEVGELAMAIGNPLGDLEGSVTLGIVSALGREVRIMGQGGMLALQGNIQVDAAINSGNSGGALVNARGELIGINVAKAGGSTSGPTVEGIGFAIPVNKMAPIVNDLIQYGYVTGKPRIGISARAISVEYREGYNMPAGVMVVDVEEGSGADKAGVRAGDIIVSLNDEAVTDVIQINGLISEMEPGDRITLGMIRGQEELEVEVVLTEWNPKDDMNPAK